MLYLMKESLVWHHKPLLGLRLHKLAIFLLDWVVIHIQGPNNFAIKLEKWVGMAKKIGDNVEISLKYEKLRHFYPWLALVTIFSSLDCWNCLCILLAYICCYLRSKQWKQYQIYIYIYIYKMIFMITVLIFRFGCS